MSDGNETRLVLNELLNYDYENQDIPGKEHFEALRTASPFVDKLKERANELGFSGDASDTKALRDFLFQLLKAEPGIVSKENEKKWKDNLRIWFTPKKGGLSPAMPSHREDVYRLCFALKMYGDKAAEFFVKGYLEQPYNFKILKETVHFYCLNNNLHYEDSIALYKKAKALPIENAATAETDTLTIGRTISDFHDEESFLDYIKQNRQSFEMDSMRATQKISELIEECIDLAKKEDDEFFFYTEENEAYGKYGKQRRGYAPQEGKTIDSAYKLLSVIYGCELNEVTNTRKEQGATELIPKLIHNSLMTNRMHIPEVSKPNASPRLKRGVLILLTFYQFFAGLRIAGQENNDDYYHEFQNVVNDALYQCGYGMLYARNPYDWMFLYCSKCTEPLEEFRNLIGEFYIEPIDEE